MAYPFLHEVPFITIVPPGMNPHQSAVLGNVLNPAYFVHLLLDFPPHMTFWQRFLNMLMHVIYPFYWRTWMVMPMIQREISRQFPKLPSLLELEGNVSLTLLNSHFSINTPLPLLPSQVEIGTIHCRPANSLPQEVESWITGAGSEGVIYFSLGSFTSSKSMPVQYRDLFVQAFHRLPQRIIWKYEGELEGVSDNVMISKWLPQQDILGEFLMGSALDKHTGPGTASLLFVNTIMFDNTLDHHRSAIMVASTMMRTLTLDHSR
ncbi:UDP-glycosyltransferase UGT5-like [Panulirus ornatus]|uniref:UDP-glycosyltransferase UGT5-like n=1 Tax=Panulirus ornatus TaxID=150431 RepID=UPI003A87F7F7